MLATILLATALGASTTTAAPTWPSLNPSSASKDGMDTVSEYFNMLARKVEAGRDMWQAPTCDLSKASLPQAPSPLEAPTEGLVLKHVAVGRGTQNYTCDTSAGAAAKPTAAGAVATLFNASCVAASYPDVLSMLPRLALKFDISDPATFDPASGSGQSDDDEEAAAASRWLSSAASRLGPSNLDVSGHHYFTDATTAFFNLDMPDLRLGEASCAKKSSSDAPSDAPRGPDGAKAVAWLKLLVKTEEGNTELAELAAGLSEVYRVQTAGGSPPSTCEGQPAEFQVQYAAEYWFYEQLT